MNDPTTLAPAASSSSSMRDALGLRLKDMYTKAKSDRAQIELRWLEDLRQYKGIYDPDELARLQVGKSKTFTRMTRIKVKSATARLMDLIFPAGSEDNWSIEPTPVPDLQMNPQLLLGLEQQIGAPLNADAAADVLKAQAEEASDRMQIEIRDQLAEAKYRKLMKHVVQSGNLFGTGILKGPLVNRSYRKAWTMDEAGAWALSNIPTLMPFIEFTPVWEMYPDTLATSFHEARYNFQRTIMPKHMVLELASRPDFSASAIKEYLRDNRDGDATLLHWESELRRIGWNLTGNTVKGKRYEVVEYWGVLDAQELIDIGLTLPDDTMEEFWVNAFLLGPKVIKIDVQPIEGMQLPYYAYYWDKDETSIFGEGIPSIMRDEQKALNAATRAMIDNAAVSAGPQFEANVDLLHPEEDPRAVYPYKVWLRSGVGAEAQYPAVRSLAVESHTQELMSMTQFFANNIHEATLPSYMHGEATSKGSVGRTASGLSMLMSSAQVTFKDQLFSLDDDVQRPFIEGMYHWNMQFNPKPEIKGDFNIVVRGTSSLVAREIRAQNLDQFANSTLNPYDAPFIDRHELNKQRAKVLELGDTVIRDKDSALMIMAQSMVKDVQPQPNQTGAPSASSPFEGDVPDTGGADPMQNFGADSSAQIGGDNFGAAGASPPTPGSDFFSGRGNSTF